MGDFLQGKRKTYTETQMMGVILDDSGEFYQEYYDRLQEIADNYTSEARILSASDAALAERLDKYAASLRDKVMDTVQAVEAKGKQIQQG